MQSLVTQVQNQITFVDGCYVSCAHSLDHMTNSFFLSSKDTRTIWFWLAHIDQCSFSYPHHPHLEYISFFTSSMTFHTSNKPLKLQLTVDMKTHSNNKFNFVHVHVVSFNPSFNPSFLCTYIYGNKYFWHSSNWISSLFIPSLIYIGPYWTLLHIQCMSVGRQQVM